MSFFAPTYQGCQTYPKSCQGDAVIGDEVKFERAVFDDGYPKARFLGYETVEGKIIKDSYGSGKQQHTFTLEVADGKQIRIKGRNLYRNGVWRKLWRDESKRRGAQAEKHDRGAVARKARDERRGVYF